MQYELSFESAVEVRSLRLYGPNGQPIPFQLSPSEGRLRRMTLSFLANLPPFGTGTQPVPQTDLRVESRRGRVCIENSLVGVEVPLGLKEARKEPLTALKLVSDRWIGGSKLKSKKLKNCEATLLAEGPVFAEVESRYTFADGTLWKIVFRIVAGEPVVLIRESFDFYDPESFWYLQLNNRFKPERLIYRAWYRVADEPLPTEEGTVYTLEPWMHAWEERHGLWVALSSE